MTAPWNTEARLEPYLRRAKAAGISKTIVFPAFHSDYGEANRHLARIIAAHPGRLIGFAMLHASRDGGVRDIEVQIKRRGGPPSNPRSGR